MQSGEEEINMAGGLKTETSGGVFHVTIDGQDEGNRLSREVLHGLRDICRRLKDDPTVHVVTVTGAGREFFSTGLLTPSLKEALGKEGVLDLVRTANDVFDAIEALPQIVVAGFNGEVRAGAAEMALACDMRIAASHSSLSWPEAKWGCFPGAGAPFRLPAIVGDAKALELICSARPVDSSEMERIGLVNRVVPSDELLDALRDLAGTLAGNGPFALRGAKRIVRLRRESGEVAARKLAFELREAFEWTADADEGVAASLQGRKPVFTGQ
ncbi:MAG: hypothetical protein CMJ42_08955 [Phyllobacteriaceae bacterium]|nr:hypothetical protein [Phyllobacteriaceae bacterium]MBA89894.1 hypothetical protein [Phyllobacteriaceae bacterium]